MCIIKKLSIQQILEIKFHMISSHKIYMKGTSIMFIQFLHGFDPLQEFHKIPTEEKWWKMLFFRRNSRFHRKFHEKCGAGKQYSGMKNSTRRFRQNPSIENSTALLLLKLNKNSGGIFHRNWNSTTLLLLKFNKIITIFVNFW